MLHSDIRANCEGLPDNDRQVRAELVGRLADCALEYGEDFAQKLIIMLGDLEDAYPGEFGDERRRLRNGLKTLVKGAHEPSLTHNHFGTASGCQVFNGAVSGHFGYKKE